MNLFFTGTFMMIAAFSSCAQTQNAEKNMATNINPTTPTVSDATGVETDTATFGTGCFWCTEAVFQQLDGVLKVSSGYSGGHVVNPTYEQVCEKNTGHAEVV